MRGYGLSVKVINCREDGNGTGRQAYLKAR